jgi:hypothetical protein
MNRMIVQRYYCFINSASAVKSTSTITVPVTVSYILQLYFSWAVRTIDMDNMDTVTIITTIYNESTVRFESPTPISSLLTGRVLGVGILHIICVVRKCMLMPC